MQPVIIFHSYSGVTRGIANAVMTACGGDLIEVTPKERYSKMSAYTLGCYRALREESEPIDPECIDVASYDLMVIGTPVWAWKATPAINAAILALKNCEGRKAVIFATCGAQAKDTLLIMRRSLEARGVLVVGEVVLTKKEIEVGTKIQDLISCVSSAMVR
jgi:flavodoxin